MRTNAYMVALTTVPEGFRAAAWSGDCAQCPIVRLPKLYFLQCSSVRCRCAGLSLITWPWLRTNKRGCDAGASFRFFLSGLRLPFHAESVFPLRH